VIKITLWAMPPRLLNGMLKKMIAEFEKTKAHRRQICEKLDRPAIAGVIGLAACAATGPWLDRDIR
jgi:hypothetical protein